MNEINITAPINSLGYGIAGVNIVRALYDEGIHVNLWPIGQVQCDKKHLPVIKEAIEHRHGYNPAAPSLRIWHQFDLAHHVGNGKRIGFPIFELNNFTDVEILEMSRMEELMVCSTWAKDILGSYVKCPIHTIPLGVDREIFHEDIGKPDPNWTTFLNIGKWEYRKGHDVIIKAFNKAFDTKDRVRLWMMTYNPFLDTRQTNEWKRKYSVGPLANAGRVNIVPRVQTHADVALVMSQADCGVFPARAEGWNLELLEMMSMGKQVIATNYSGHTEFCNFTNTHLIEVDKLEVAYDGVFFDGKNGGEWAKLENKQIDQLVEHMRYIHKHKEQINSFGIETAKNYTWQNTANEVKNVR